MLSAEEISDKLKANQNKYQSYIDDFDRTASGAGSSKGTDRLSAQDIRDIESERGDLSRAESAEMILAYADKAADEGSKTEGGGTKRELDRLRGYLNDAPEEIEVADPEPIQMSKVQASANAGVQAYDEHILPNKGTIIMGLDKGADGKSTNTQNYLDAFSLNLAKNLEPVNADGSSRESKLRQEEDAVEGFA